MEFRERIYSFLIKRYTLLYLFRIERLGGYEVERSMVYQANICHPTPNTNHLNRRGNACQQH